MGIEIVLYDSSPIVQKIFFHILYHYSPIVHRIDETSALMEKIKYSKPDIIFIDAALSKNNNLVNKINETEELKKIPIILMSKIDLDQRELESISAQDILKKPIEAESLRQLITRFVSKTKSNILTKHLEFPSIPNFIENQDKKEKSVTPKQQKTSTETGIELVTETEEPQLEKEKSPPKEQKEASTETGIELVTDTEKLQPEKEKKPPKEQKEASTETGIELATDTKESQSEKEKASVEQKTSTKTSIKPITAVTEKKEETGLSKHEPLIKKSIPPKEETKPKTEIQKSNEIEQQEVEALEQPDTEEQQQEAEVFEQPPDIKKEEQNNEDPVKEENTITESDLNIQMKSKVDDYIKTIGEEILKIKIEEISEQKIQKEIEEKIKNYQETILKTIEKSVWQVVPELAKQLITKEIDKLLKDDETD